MEKLISKQWSQHAGVSPDELMGHKHTETHGDVEITLYEYDFDSFSERIITDIAELKKIKETQTIKWVNVDGIHDLPLVEKICKIFQIHPLTIEDIVNTDQRPKFEDYATYDVAMMKMLFVENGKLHSEQLTIILMENIVICFQEAEGGDAFDPVRDRLRQGKGRIKKQGSDFMAYSLIDAIVDSYFKILEDVGDQIEKLDVELIEDPTPETLKRLNELKREMLFLRKNIWPLRELVTSIERSESDQISETTMIYFRDVRDHILRVIETVENYRDIIAGMMDIYMSSLSVKMNEVMKVLTLISSIFIPITFLVGVYGMNFHYMPELHSHYGYPAVWVVMIGVAVFMISYFRRKKWL